MIEQQKYGRLRERLRGRGKCEDYEEEAGFYFSQLQRLQIDLLVGQIEVAEQQRQIGALQNKIGNVQAQNHRTESQHRRAAESSSEEFLREYWCPLKECGKRFQKQSDVTLHQRIAHSADPCWLAPTLFDLQLEE